MIKTKLCLITIILLLLGCSPSIKNAESKGKNIICFGDSITAGVGSKDSKGYVEMLDLKVERNVINAGVSGDTTRDALQRIKEDVLSKHPYLVIVEFGGNDYLRGIPKQDTLNNLGKIIDSIQRQGAMVVLCDMSCNIILSGYRKDYKSIAYKKGCIYIPGLLKGVLNNPLHRSDHIHPNAKGYKIIGERIYKNIKPFL